ncbi:uncharacterized protein LAESUDRAFT_645198 [Laetiporus sulphureus 93-53]|uniref:Uncharacterized protein n=1 Tax=Laetiporus sulphureus 93-53 TaxID=1314785 RepID=A0A165GJA1_9APHY|nr:uncharacterized protein LAESUDRAFT_645198 [Laetiporus sulphureus 93-53]KZT10429.1 hypothetical protein LAESUDRAFT_645198 [Laetiporus sulphureus 93-53]
MYVFANNPNFLAFITNQKQIQLDSAVYIEEQGTKYGLCDIIYFDGFHFTARIVDMNGQMRYNDRIVTGNTLTLEDPLKMAQPTHLNKAHDRLSSMAIYIKLC